eukprot:scaffold1788_cov396-Prasinococcus_capsulatus_cf.AAC.4
MQTWCCAEALLFTARGCPVALVLHAHHKYCPRAEGLRGFGPATRAPPLWTHPDWQAATPRLSSSALRPEGPWPGSRA